MNKNALSYDILKELFNISVGKAASMLSEIVNRKIILDVPNIDVLDADNANIRLDDCIPKSLDGALMVSSISFEQNLNGKANLIFPAEKMRTFINICMNESYTENEIDISFNEIDFDIIKEIGNIILNTIVGEVGNFLNVHLEYTLPEVKVFNKRDFNRDIDNTGYMHALILQISFLIDETEIEGAILVDLTLNSLNELTKKISNIEEMLNE